MLSRGRRGMIRTTKTDEVWIVESEEDAADLIGRRCEFVHRIARALDFAHGIASSVPAQKKEPGQLMSSRYRSGRIRARVSITKCT